MAAAGAGRKLNKLASSVAKLTKPLPDAYKPWGYTLAFDSMVKLAGTAGVWVEEMSGSRAVVTLKNRRRVQNHIGGIHACGMALAAESATGIVVGMNVPDTALPLCKSMKVNFIRRCEGDIRAVAHLTEEQLTKIHTEEKGDVLVNVEVTDSSGKSPITAEMVWAWVPKARKPSSSPSSSPPTSGGGGGKQ